MNRIVIALSTLPLACLFVFAQEQTLGTEQQVLQTEHGWVQAAVHGDVDTMASFMSEKWIALFSDGTTIDKATWVQGMRSGKNKFNKVEFTEERVIVHDKVALFIGRFTEKGSWDGKGFEDTGTEMSTFLKEDGRWQVISSAFGQSPEPVKK